MFFETGFEGSTNLTYVRFATRARDLVKSWPQHRARFVFRSFEQLFKGLYSLNTILIFFLARSFEIKLVVPWM
jgi:hypothetical protein